jgi:putative DNA primase/helicase
MHTSHIESAFLDAAARRGIVIKRLIADGQLHRCDAEGRGGKGDAAYKLYLDGVPAGGFQNWRDGLGWTNWHASGAPVMTPEERAAFRAKMLRQQREREEARQCAAEKAREKARWILEQSEPADPRHPYLVKKQVQPHGLRSYKDALVVPMRSARGELHSLQFIDGAGCKRFLRGGVKEACYFGIGRPDANGSISIAEGFATGASIFEAAEIPVSTAFDACNLLLVALALREKYPEAQIILFADDDWQRNNPLTGEPENIGAIQARIAAEAIGGIAVTPAFAEDRGEGDTDFNDMARLYGLEAVRARIVGRSRP